MNEAVLVIEDEPKIARLLELELQYEGYQVRQGWQWNRRTGEVCRRTMGSDSAGCDVAWSEWN